MSTVAVQTLTKKELRRFLRVPLQTVGTPIITTLLYFLVFGYAMGSRIGEVQTLSYTQFIMPGLIMMNVLTTAFLGISSGLMLQKIMGNLSDILVSPMSYFEIVLSFMLSSVIRSVFVAALIYLTALFFVPFHIEHFFYLLSFTILVAAAFSLLGFIAGMWAENFEQVSFFPTFIIMPLTFLGGVFYSIHMLPETLQKISYANPFLYMISGVRYGFYGTSDVSPWLAFGIVTVLFTIFGLVTLYLLRIGYKIRT